MIEHSLQNRRPELESRIVQTLVGQRSLSLDELRKLMSRRPAEVYAALRGLRRDGQVVMNSQGRWDATEKSVKIPRATARSSVLSALALLLALLTAASAGAHPSTRLSSQNPLADDCPTRARQMLYEAVIEHKCDRVRIRNAKVCKLAGAKAGSPEFEMAVALDACRVGGRILGVSQNRSRVDNRAGKAQRKKVKRAVNLKKQANQRQAAKIRKQQRAQRRLAAQRAARAAKAAKRSKKN